MATELRNEATTQVSLKEIMDALPDDLNEPTELKDSLKALLDNLSHKEVPVGALARFWTLGSLQAKLFAGYTAYFLRKGFVSKDKQEKLVPAAQILASLTDRESLPKLQKWVAQQITEATHG